MLEDMISDKFTNKITSLNCFCNVYSNMVQLHSKYWFQCFEDDKYMIVTILHLHVMIVMMILTFTLFDWFVPYDFDLRYNIEQYWAEMAHCCSSDCTNSNAESSNVLHSSTEFCQSYHNFFWACVPFTLHYQWIHYTPFVVKYLLPASYETGAHISFPISSFMYFGSLPPSTG